MATSLFIHIFLTNTLCTHTQTVLCGKEKISTQSPFKTHTHTAVFNKMPHPICIYSGTEQCERATERAREREREREVGPKGEKEVNTYTTLQKHKPFQHKSPLTHCQNTLRQIAKDNQSLCQTHTHKYTQTLRHSSVLCSSPVQKTEAGQTL